MNKMIALVCLGYAFVVPASAIAGAQQEKMKGCNEEAKMAELKGDERKAFMSKCLKKDYKLKSQSAGGKAEAEAVSMAKKEKMDESAPKH